MSEPACLECLDGRHGFHDSRGGTPSSMCGCWCLKEGEDEPTITVTLEVDVRPLGDIGFEAWCPALGCRATAGTRIEAISAVEELADETLHEQELAARKGCY